ncbi:MAG: hypothetical protein U0838_09960 [Chloroflexota bacterium]
MSDLERLGLSQRPLSRRTMLRGVAGLSAAAGLGAIAAACGSSTASPSAASAAPTTAPTSAPTQGTSAAPSAPASSAPSVEPTPMPSPESELFIYNWADYVGEKTIANFSDKYGIKVTYDFFPDTDTQTAKIATGKSGYDVTFPTSTYVKGFVAQGNLLQPLDHSLLPNLANLAPGGRTRRTTRATRTRCPTSGGRPAWPTTRSGSRPT